MYQSRIIEMPTTGRVQHIFRANEDGSVTSFPNVESNDGPERAAFLAWVAEGNQPEIIEP